MFSAGDRIGQFRVVREIGQGGMGCVYEVVADENAKRLALKVFSLDHGNREFLRRRFLAEAKILSRLNHPRLVHVHESGIDESSGTPYYVMDLVQSAVGKSETLEDVRKGLGGDFPRHLQNVHADSYTMEREQGHLYPHDYPNHWVAQQYLPDALAGKHYYEFGPNKLEQASKAYWDAVKK